MQVAKRCIRRWQKCVFTGSKKTLGELELVSDKSGPCGPLFTYSGLSDHPSERTSILTHMVKNTVIGMATDTRHHEWICLVGGVTRSVASDTSGIPVVSHLDILREGYIRPVTSAFAEDKIEITVGIGAVDGMNPVGDGYGMVVRLIVACQTIVSVKGDIMSMAAGQMHPGVSVAIGTIITGDLLIDHIVPHLKINQGGGTGYIIVVTEAGVVRTFKTHHVGTFHACRDRQQLIVEAGEVSGDPGIGAEYKQGVTLGRRVRFADEVRIGDRTRGQYRHGLGARAVHIQVGGTQAATGVPRDVLRCGVE